jgi:hypothetical protein
LEFLEPTGVSKTVRLVFLPTALLLTGCSPGLVFNNSEMTPDQMQARASHVFIGVIEKQEFENWLFLDIPAQSTATGQS